MPVPFGESILQCRYSSRYIGCIYQSSGRPYVHQLISCRADAPQEFILPTRKLPAGVLQVSLINRAGNTLCERFVFSNPRAPLQLSAEGLKEVYTPYAPIRCELQVKNAKGEPVSGDVSVSIRDAVRSDYLEYDNNIFTDLLLTSDLKDISISPVIICIAVSPETNGTGYIINGAWMA